MQAHDYMLLKQDVTANRILTWNYDEDNEFHENYLVVKNSTS